MTTPTFADQNRFVLVIDGIAWAWHPDGIKPLFVGARQPSRASTENGAPVVLGELGTICVEGDRKRYTERRRKAARRLPA